MCLEGLVGKDPVKIPCSHVICLTCISEWISQERSCPMCKRQIPEDFRIQSSKIIRLDFFSLLKWLVSQWRVEDRKLQTWQPACNVSPVTKEIRNLSYLAAESVTNFTAYIIFPGLKPVFLGDLIRAYWQDLAEVTWNWLKRHQQLWLKVRKVPLEFGDWEDHYFNNIATKSTNLSYGRCSVLNISLPS